MPAYRKAAVASTFSPTHRAVLAEAVAFSAALGATLEVLHASESTPEKCALFAETFSVLGISPEVIWLPGDHPGQAIVGAVRERGYDLLVAGALERDPDHEERAFTGRVARRLLNEAPCDVLLLPRPTEVPAKLASAFFAVEPGQDISSFVVRIVKALGLTQVTVAVAETPFAAAIANSRGEEAVDVYRWADEVASEIELPGLEVEARVIDSNTGFGLCDAAQGSGADLMVVRGRRSGEGMTLPHHLDWLRQVIPMRLLICGDA